MQLRALLMPLWLRQIYITAAKAHGIKLFLWYLFLVDDLVKIALTQQTLAFWTDRVLKRIMMILIPSHVNLLLRIIICLQVYLERLHLMFFAEISWIILTLKTAFREANLWQVHLTCLIIDGLGS